MELSAQILEAVQTLCGEQDAAFVPICNAAAAYLTAQLRAGVRPEDCADALVLAGALTVCAVYRELQENGRLQRFEAGTLSLAFRDGDGTLLEQARRLIAPWCAGTVAFCGVRT